MVELLKRIVANKVGRILLAVLVFGLPGLFTYVIPCKPCYDATMTVGKLLDEALNGAAQAVQAVTGVETPAEVPARAE